MDYTSVPTPPKSSKSSDTSVDSNDKDGDARTSITAGTNSCISSSADIRRAFWPIYGTDGEIISISIATDVSIKSDLRPASNLCGESLPMALGGGPVDQLAMTLAELREVLPPKPLSDHDLYNMLQLGLGRAMSKTYSTDLREGVGSIRLRRPNRGKSAKVLVERVWYYASWKSTRGKIYQLFGSEGVIFGLDNRTEGRVRCVIQNDDPPEDQKFAIPACTSMTIWQENLGVDRSGNHAVRPGAMTSPIDARSIRIKSPSPDGQPRLDGTSGLQIAQYGPSYQPFSQPGHYQGATGPAEKYATQPSNHLLDMESRFPSSDIWPCLAEGERRRRKAGCPVDPLLSLPSAESGTAAAAHTGLSEVGSMNGTECAQCTWKERSDRTDSAYYGIQPGFDFGGLPGGFDLQRPPATGFPDYSQYASDIQMGDYGGEQSVGGDTYGKLELSPRDMGGLPIFGQCLCEQAGAAKKEAETPTLDGLDDQLELTAL